MVEEKSFHELKSEQLSHRTIPILEENEYDTSILHNDINELLTFDKNGSTLVLICDHIINAGLRCRNSNIEKIFVSSVAFCSKVPTDMLRERNHFLYQACEEHGFTFIDNGAVKQRYLRNDCVQLLKSSKIIIANNLIHNIITFYI